jgi:DNA polymerase III delta prime subunit
MMLNLSAMKNYLVTGPVGSGKTTIARELAATLGMTVVEWNHEVEAPPPVWDAGVIILDEVGPEAWELGRSRVEARLAQGARAVYVARTVASSDPEIVRLLQRFGGFRHVQLGEANCLLAQLEIIPMSEGVKNWQAIFATMPQDKREDAVNRVLGDLSAAVADSGFAPTERAVLNMQIGLLASAVRAQVRCAAPAERRHTKRR